MRWGIFLLLVILLGCSSNVQYTTKGKANRKVHKKYNINNDQTYETITKPGNITYMVCSYYGKKFHGKPTANGETFDMEKLTCAHKSLKFGTRLKVTNEDNNKSVIVRVNDRGPFIRGRDLDLSKAAAREIGLIPYGVKNLKVEFLENEEKTE